MWDGAFEVEKRESWISRNSERWSSDFEVEKEKAKWKEPLTKEQLAQAKPPLVSVDILNHDFQGYGTPEDPYLVRWIENDPANPMLFPKAKKWTNAMVLAFAVFMVSIASSGFSQGTCTCDRVIRRRYTIGASLVLTRISQVPPISRPNSMSAKPSPCS